MSRIWKPSSSTHYCTYLEENCLDTCLELVNIFLCSNTCRERVPQSGAVVWEHTFAIRRFEVWCMKVDFFGLVYAAIDSHLVNRWSFCTAVSCSELCVCVRGRSKSTGYLGPVLGVSAPLKKSRAKIYPFLCPSGDNLWSECFDKTSK